MAIYPNPTDGIINLVIPAGKEAKAVISIINAVGKEVTRAEIAISEGSNITALDVSHLAAGVYSATVNMENQPQKTMPFVKQ